MDGHSLQMQRPPGEPRGSGFRCTIHRFPQSLFRLRVSWDDMEQLLRSPLEEFDLAAEDSGGNSDLGAAPPSPHELSDDDTQSVEWSLQGDSEETVSLPEVVADVFPPLLPQLRAVFVSMDHVDVVAILRQLSALTSVPRKDQRPFQERAESCHRGGFQWQDPRRKKKRWKLFLGLPRILPHL